MVIKFIFQVSWSAGNKIYPVAATEFARPLRIDVLNILENIAWPFNNDQNLFERG